MRTRVIKAPACGSSPRRRTCDMITMTAVFQKATSYSLGYDLVGLRQHCHPLCMKVKFGTPNLDNPKIPETLGEPP